jgi:hypothetical protein
MKWSIKHILTIKEKLVATAPPLIPYLGIKKIFKMTLTTAETIGILYTRCTFPILAKIRTYRFSNSVKDCPDKKYD